MLVESAFCERFLVDTFAELHRARARDALELANGEAGRRWIIAIARRTSFVVIGRAKALVCANAGLEKRDGRRGYG
jgi:hypothetical protein